MTKKYFISISKELEKSRKNYPTAPASEKIVKHMFQKSHKNNFSFLDLYKTNLV